MRKKLPPWSPGHTPDEVWDLAIERVKKGEHLVHAVLTAVYDTWQEPPGTGGAVYQRMAPEVKAISFVRFLERAEQGVDHFANYTIDEAVNALEGEKRMSP